MARLIDLLRRAGKLEDCAKFLEQVMFLESGLTFSDVVGTLFRRLNMKLKKKQLSFHFFL